MTHPNPKTITVELTQMPPSANSMRQHFVKNGKVQSAKTSNYASWKKAAAKEAQSQYTRPAIDRPYVLEIAVQRNWRSKRARDIDNLTKPISDALVAGGVISDDHLCERVTTYWSDHLKGVAVIATIEEVR